MGICLIFFLAKVNVTVSSVGRILTLSKWSVRAFQHGMEQLINCFVIWGFEQLGLKQNSVWTHLLQQLFRWSHVHTTNLNIYKTPNLQKQWVSTCFKLFASISFVLFFFLALCSWLQGLAEVRYVIACIFVLRNPNSESGIVLRKPF